MLSRYYCNSVFREILKVVLSGSIGPCSDVVSPVYGVFGNDSNLLIVFYVQIMPDDFVMQLHRF